MENNEKWMGNVTFQGSVTFNGPMFDIHDNENVHIGVEDGAMSSKCKGGVREMDPIQLACAIENCQQYFWANASYAVVFCICRDDYNMTPNMSAFEKKVESLPYKKKRDFVCKKGTITNAFSDNSIYYSHVDKWEEKGADERQIKLRDELRKELAKESVL